MANALFLLAPIFLLLTLGKVIKKTIVTDEEPWFSINKITYSVLFPTLHLTKHQPWILALPLMIMLIQS
ncbi:hypothetical protein HWV03_13970 [Moritella sp. 36]|uniref:hypothetical protein n=1 Tax=Moritella sp. 36 TaxID=2746233 RepID=UPI001BA76B3F|nr:hypothetical protein [Moritella sp. 36]QUM89834.1 hypothetical protein HWV03_13970 [Moritella sp. 36]